MERIYHEESAIAGSESRSLRRLSEARHLEIWFEVRATHVGPVDLMPAGSGNRLLHVISVNINLGRFAIFNGCEIGNNDISAACGRLSSKMNLSDATPRTLVLDM